MALSFIKKGITDADRLKNKKSSVADESWDGLKKYFKDKLNKKTEKLIRETVYAKRTHKNFPMEARMMFGNSNVPLGETEVTDQHGKTKIYYVKSVPCKDVEQGKALLTEFIENYDKDKDVMQTLVRWFNENEKLKFDTTTLPEVS